MFHLCAYTGSISLGTDIDVAALTDTVLIIQNGHFLPQNDFLVYAAYATSPSALRAKLSSPTLRLISPVYIRPVSSGAALPAANPNVDIKYYSPLRIHMLEELQMLASISAAGPERFTALLWLVDQFEPAPLGDVYHIRWTSTVAAVANSWTIIGTPTFEQNLPYGQYALIDSEHFSTNAIAHRLIFDQQYERPGTLSGDLNSNRNPYALGFGKLGKWGTFRTTNLPRVELLCNAADAVHEGYMHVVKVA